MYMTHPSKVHLSCYRCLHKHDSPLEVGDLYWQLKDSVAKYELLLLRALKFNVHIQLPHTVSVSMNLCNVAWYCVMYISFHLTMHLTF